MTSRRGLFAWLGAALAAPKAFAAPQSPVLELDGCMTLAEARLAAGYAAGGIVDVGPAIIAGLHPSQSFLPPGVALPTIADWQRGADDLSIVRAYLNPKPEFLVQIVPDKSLDS